LALTLLRFVQLVRGSRTRLVFLGVIVFCLSLVLIFSPQANVDNFILSPNTQRVSLTASELQAMGTLMQKSQGQLWSDQYYISSSTYYFNKTNQVVVTFWQRNVTPNDLLLVRAEMVGKPSYDGVVGETYPTGPIVQVNPSGSLVYSSGSVNAYYNASRGFLNEILS
jgi:hypothetical protein